MTRFGIELLRHDIKEAVSIEGLRPFCRRSNIPVGVVRSFIDAKDTYVSNIKKLAEAIGLELYIGPPRGEAPGPVLIDLDACSYTALPLYTDVRLSAGAGALNAESPAIRPVACSNDVLSVLGVAPQHAMLLTVAGDSMEPLFHQGDTVLIDRARTTPPLIPPAARKLPDRLAGHRPAPAFAFIGPDGEARIKHLRRHPRLGVIASSANPAWPPEIYELPAANRITILGQVAALARALHPRRARSVSDPV